MKTLRVGVFETNSSSQHEICYPCASAYANLHVEPCTIEVEGSGNYDWGYEVLETPAELLDYWLVAVSMDGGLSDCYETEKVKVIKYFASKQVTLVLPETTEGISGYIDHQSVYRATMLGAFIHDPEALFNFVFCPESKIIIDNDNH
jgi:hypothetical protein